MWRYNLKHVPLLIWAFIKVPISSQKSEGEVQLCKNGLLSIVSEKDATQLEQQANP